MEKNEKDKIELEVKHMCCSKRNVLCVEFFRYVIEMKDKTASLSQIKYLSCKY